MLIITELELRHCEEMVKRHLTTDNMNGLANLTLGLIGNVRALRRRLEKADQDLNSMREDAKLGRAFRLASHKKWKIV